MVANMSVQADVWFSYVASKANIADLPSRGALDEMAAVLRGVEPAFCLDRDRVDLVPPVCYPDASAIWAAVVAQLGLARAAEAARERRPRGRKRARGA